MHLKEEFIVKGFAIDNFLMVLSLKLILFVEKKRKTRISVKIRLFVNSVVVRIY